MLLSMGVSDVKQKNAVQPQNWHKGRKKERKKRTALFGVFTLLRPPCGMDCTTPSESSHRYSEGVPQNILANGTVGRPPSTSHNLSIMAIREIISFEHSVATCITCATHSHPERVDNACRRRAVAAIIADSSCWDVLRATNLLTASPATMPRTPPSAFWEMSYSLLRPCPQPFVERVLWRDSPQERSNFMPPKSEHWFQMLARHARRPPGAAVGCSVGGSSPRVARVSLFNIISTSSARATSGESCILVALGARPKKLQPLLSCECLGRAFNDVSTSWATTPMAQCCGYFELNARTPCCISPTFPVFEPIFINGSFFCPSSPSKGMVRQSLQSVFEWKHRRDALTQTRFVPTFGISTGLSAEHRPAGDVHLESPLKVQKCGFRVEGFRVRIKSARKKKKNRKKGGQKGKKAPKEYTTLPSRRAPELIFYIRIVRRNRYEIEYQKIRFRAPDKEIKKKKGKKKEKQREKHKEKWTKKRKRKIQRKTR